VSFVESGGGESKLETAISYLLIIGVVASLALEIVGIVLFHHCYGQFHLSEDKVMFLHGRNFFNFLHVLLCGGFPDKSPILFMTLGVITLILIPYVRVIVSVLHFAWKRNIKYVLITGFVFAVLTISLGLH
jgi:uncharacterized membrane protein